MPFNLTFVGVLPLIALLRLLMDGWMDGVWMYAWVDGSYSHMYVWMVLKKVSKPVHERVH